ncbi:MAG: hypothetical protein ACRDRX_25760 [Pseudonocardiaceae bacterium]
MTRIGITGHRGLPAPTARLVARALRDTLADYGANVTGVTALADGADQLFARAILDLGGHIEVIVPATRSREGLPAQSHPEYNVLLRQVSMVHRPEFTVRCLGPPTRPRPRTPTRTADTNHLARRSTPRVSRRIRLRKRPQGTMSLS